MSNWKAGDRAICVEEFFNKDVDSLKTFQSKVPEKGKTYIVLHYEKRNSVRLKREIGGLELGGFDGLWLESRFRKVVPACDRIAQQEEGLIPHEGFWEGRPDL